MYCLLVNDYPVLKSETNDYFAQQLGTTYLQPDLPICQVFAGWKPPQPLQLYHACTAQ